MHESAKPASCTAKKVQSKAPIRSGQLVRQSGKMPCDAGGEEQIDADIQAKPNKDAAIAHVCAEMHAVHGIADGEAGGRGRLEVQKPKRMASRKKDEQYRRDPVE